jgi:hypothetical protein
MRPTRTPDGLRWLVERDVDAPAETVWSILTDTRRWPEWGPVVADVESSTRYVETRTIGRIRFEGTAAPVPFAVREVDDVAHRWTWDLARLFGSGHRVESLPDGSRVGFELPLAAPGLGPLVYRACSNVARMAEVADS